MSEANATNGNSAGSGQRTKTGQFVKGHRGLGGRKVGSRNRLSESFLADLHAEWKRSGKKVLQAVAEKHPETFLRVVGQVLPRVMEFDGVMNVQHHSTLHIEARDFLEAYERWGKHIGANVSQLIEAEVIEDETNDEQSDNDER
jgi:hypothetical protein